jgi:hypothetical protein
MIINALIRKYNCIAFGPIIFVLIIVLVFKNPSSLKQVFEDENSNCKVLLLENVTLKLKNYMLTGNYYLDQLNSLLFE